MTRLLNSMLTLLVFMSSAVALIAAGEINLPTVIAPSPPTDFLTQVLSTVQGLGGMSMLMKLSAVITLVIASMKVGILKDVIWDRLGAAQVWIAPLLGLLAGVAGLGAGAQNVTPHLVFAYVIAGGGAVFLHELLDSLKAVPGLGPVYIKAIDVVDGALGGSGKPQVAPPASASEARVAPPPAEKK